MTGTKEYYSPEVLDGESPSEKQDVGSLDYPWVVFKHVVCSFLFLGSSIITFWLPIVD